MERVTNQIVDQHGAAAYATGLLAEARQLRRFQVMREQAATDKIETVVAKRQRERVGNQGHDGWAAGALERGRDR